MPSVIQRGFSGGELDPALHARADLAKYAISAKTVRNMVIRKEGAATNRSGFKYIADGGDLGDVISQLIPFVFSIDQSYVIVLLGGAIRFLKNDDWLRLSSTPTAWSNATAYVIGDLVSLAGVNYYCIADHTNQSPPYGSYWFTLEDDIYSILCDYTNDEAPYVKYAQSGDTMIFTHPDHPQRILRRFAETTWTIEDMTLAPEIDAPENCAGTAGGAGANTYRYRITALGPDGTKESLPGRDAVLTPGTLNPNLTPWQVTKAAHGYTTGDVLYTVSGGSPVSPALGEGTQYTITVTGANTYTLDGTVAVGFPATYGIYTYRWYVPVYAAAVPTSAAPIVLTWDAVPGSTQYAVYKESNGVYGFIGYSGVGETFSDINIIPDTTSSHPVVQDIFNATDDYPSVVAFVQQRLAFANSNNNPETVWESRVGDYFNFTKSTITQDDDSIEFTLAGSQVNEIQNILDLGRLLLFSAGGIWSVDGDSDGVVRPTAINLRQQVYSGSSALKPLIVVNSALYVQARGNAVRDLGFSFQDDGYRSNDLSAYAGHLLSGYTITDWAYQETPHSVIWAVRSDGTLLSLTYIKEQEIRAWSHHDTTFGRFKKVCVIPENGEDVLYAVVNADVGGNTPDVIVRMVNRQFTETEDAFFVDGGLTYDGTGATTTSMDLSTGAGWTPDDTLTLTASVATFSAGDVGNAFVLHSGDDSVICTVTAYTSTTVVSVQPDVDVIPALRDATTVWSRAVDEFSGLDHLEGQMVSILADGSVISDGTDAAYTVSGGEITLDSPYSKVHIGLPITADLELLPVEDPQDETLVDKRLTINQATLMLEASGAPSVGPDEDRLREVPPLRPANLGDITPLITGNVTVGLNNTWDDHGRTFIRHTDPLPLTVLGVVRRGRVEKAPM
jgi:hypothetical protein